MDDDTPELRQINYLRKLIAKEEENYKTAVTNKINFSVLKSMRLDLKLLRNYLQVLITQDAT
ncbi:MAG TPA: hypothetical protein VHA52_00465 [Candidatus Babeliaceae bacterium]|nr:hypothetical protein [Candidatus Babeliaceae bacterium]